MITLQITPIPSLTEREYIRQLVGFYRGIASTENSGLCMIQPKKDFSLESLLCTLRSMGYHVRQFSKNEG